MTILERGLRKIGVINDPSYNKYLKRSFSQSGEDIIMKYIFDALGIHKPSFIDIGAHHPHYLNNTFLFYLNGSRGINIEPDFKLFEQFPIFRKDDINLNFGIGVKTEVLDFYLISAPALNTFSKEEAERIVNETNNKIKEIKKIQIKTIKDVVETYCNNIFPDILSIDVEGMDELIIKSISFEKNTPKVICIESIAFSENGRGEKQTNLIEYIKSKGYLLYADTNINTLFVLKEIWER